MNYIRDVCSILEHFLDLVEIDLSHSVLFSCLDTEDCSGSRCLYHQDVSISLWLTSKSDLCLQKCRDIEWNNEVSICLSDVSIYNKHLICILPVWTLKLTKFSSIQGRLLDIDLPFRFSLRKSKFGLSLDDMIIVLEFSHFGI